MALGEMVDRARYPHGQSSQALTICEFSKPRGVAATPAYLRPSRRRRAPALRVASLHRGDRPCSGGRPQRPRHARVEYLQLRLAGMDAVLAVGFSRPGSAEAERAVP